MRADLPATTHNAATAATRATETHMSVRCDVVVGSSDAAIQRPTSRPPTNKAASTRQVYPAAKRRSPYAKAVVAIDHPSRLRFQTAATIRSAYGGRSITDELITSVTAKAGREPTPPA